MAKILVSIPDELLERVDHEARRRSSTRSAFLQRAAQHELGWPDPDAIDAAVERGRAALASAGRFESTKLIRRGRQERDARDRRR